jgi:hypothetical protein
MEAEGNIKIECEERDVDSANGLQLAEDCYDDPLYRRSKSWNIML